MSKQDYVGQYFINNVGRAGLCEQEVGECVWEDSESLFCAHHVEDSCGAAFHSILPMPMRFAHKIKWYGYLDEFEQAIASVSNDSLEMKMTSYKRDEVSSLRVPEHLRVMFDILWSGSYDLTGNCVAALAGCLEECPEKGELLAEHIAAESAKYRARKATIDAIAKWISDAGLIGKVSFRSGLVTQTDDHGHLRT